MHLAIVSTFPPSKGTLCEYAEHLVRAFATKPEVTQISLIADQLPDPNQAETIHINGVTVHRVWRFNDPGNLLHIRSTLEKLKPDAVLYNLQFASFGDRKVPAALALLSPLASRMSGFPTISLLHNLMETIDLERAGFAGNRLLEFVMRTAGNIFTRALLASDLLATTMPRYVDILRKSYRAKNTFLAPHGAFHRTTPMPLPAQRTVMTFGKFGTYKVVEPLLEAHKILLELDPNIRLVIAGGDSPNAKGYLAGVQERYADVPNVTFTGYVPEEAVAGIFTDCSVVAFPYNSTTGSSGVLHQTGEFARAAVMPQIGDLADLIQAEGYSAEFFEPDNAKSLADAIWQTIKNPEHARQAGLNNHAAATGLTLEDVADWYLMHFERLQQRRNSQMLLQGQVAKI